MSRSEWTNRTFPSRRNFFLIGGGVLFGGITLRLAELQLLRSGEYNQLAKDTQIRLDPAPPHRGTIYDRHGRQLATNKRNFFVTLTPEESKDLTPEDAKAQVALNEVLDRLGQIIPISDRRRSTILRDAKSRPFDTVVVADDLTWEDFSKINARSAEMAGVSADVGELRSYPYYQAFYHTVGYVARPNDAYINRFIASELDASGEPADSPAGKARTKAIKKLYLNPQMRVGRAGIENSGEQSLKGEPGKLAQLVNAGGRVIEPVPQADVPGKKGTDIVLTLDAELQNFAIQAFGEQAGSAIVIDIKTGEVIVMMSTPSPDPNEFVSRLSDEYWAQLQNDEKAPLYDKAYEGRYPPGSTFKIVVAAAALESGKVKPSDTVHCSGKVWFGNRYFNCWRPEGHGTMNLHTGLQHSCDCYFYNIAMRTGIEEIARVGKQFGMGHQYLLGLSGGKAGVMPNDAWKRKRFKEQWYDGDTMSAAIGQGYVLATPFEMAVMAARIAGGHAVPNPHLMVSGLEVPDQTIEPLGDIKEETLAMVRAGMFAVTSEPGGTALKFGALDEKNELPAPYTGARMAGKSGSAQVRVISAAERNAQGKALGNDKFAWALRDHAHFVAYAPHDKPRYSIAITVEHGGSGSSVAAPYAQAILREVLKADPGNKPRFKPPEQVADAGGRKT